MTDDTLFEGEDATPGAATIAESVQVMRAAQLEFQHHAARMEQDPKANEHTRDIARLYRDAARAARVLRRFQEGRLRRAAGRREGITAEGHAEAVTE